MENTPSCVKNPAHRFWLKRNLTNKKSVDAKKTDFKQLYQKHAQNS